MSLNICFEQYPTPSCTEPWQLKFLAQQGRVWHYLNEKSELRNGFGYPTLRLRGMGRAVGGRGGVDGCTRIGPVSSTEIICSSRRHPH